MVRLSDLRDRDVINLDGKRLGVISDLDLDLENGRIRALVLPGSGGFMGMLGARKNDLIIPWEQVRKIGVDAILVDYPIEFERG
ncbi:MAG: YlmC/YmxH family sporulation protein [Firmicutes bacterium]|nr:YlmC/YmxH family sporulation protein [Bacillota bacterium]